MQVFNFSLINLGCTKNLVDSQHFLGRILDMSIKSHDYQVNYFADPFDKETKYVFVNTCGFISSGREEADATVKKLLKAKKVVYLMGCAVQYYKKLTKQDGIDGVDRIGPIPSNPSNPSGLHYLSWGDMNKVGIKELLQGYDSKVYGEFGFPTSPRVYTNIDQKYEYLKIAEGCDNKCTFCIIPQIRGKLISRTIPDIVKETENMIQNGIKEIILIAQDTTRYGYDRFGKSALLTLLKRLDRIPGDFTYRLLYLYPDIMTLNQIKEMKKLKKLIPYFDIPLQHISSSVLKKMGRFYDEAYIKKFLDQIKDSFPIRFVRTNFIIGFPGETKEDFKKLLKFVEQEKFDNIALFEYHDEPLAASSKLPDKVPDAEIRTRFTKIRQLVNKQLFEREQARKGMEEVGYITEVHYPTLNPSPLHGEGSRLPKVYTVGNNKLPSGDTMIELARNLRKNQTKAESFLWELLRNRQVNNLKFRRQHPIGNYIADFYCPAKSLVIELDGSVHNNEEQKKRDQERDAIMKQHNITVIRFTNNDVFKKTDEVLQTIIDISNKSPLVEPVPQTSAGEWRGVGGEVTLVVRPRLNCPEIDDVDEISLPQVIGTFDGKKELEIGDKIIYTL